MILKGKSGAEAELPINLFDLLGAPIEGHVWVTGEVLLALPGGVLEDADVDNIVEKEKGRYALQLTAFESATAGAVMLHLDTTNGYLPHAWHDQIIDIGGVVRDAILNYSHRTGRTVRGLFRRLEALVTGKVTGLKGTSVTFFQPGIGAPAEFTTVQDPSGGNRSESDVTNSEVP